MLRRTVETLQLLAGPVTRWSGRAALTAPGRSFSLQEKVIPGLLPRVLW